MNDEKGHLQAFVCKIVDIRSKFMIISYLRHLLEMIYDEMSKVKKDHRIVTTQTNFMLNSEMIEMKH